MSRGKKKPLISANVSSAAAHILSHAVVEGDPAAFVENFSLRIFLYLSENTPNRQVSNKMKWLTALSFVYSCVDYLILVQI